MSCFQFFYLLVSGSQVPILAHPEKTTANLGFGTIQESSSLCQNLARPDSIDTTCTENSNENWLMKLWWLLMIYWWLMMHDDCSYATTMEIWKWKWQKNKIITQGDNLLYNLLHEKSPQTPAPWHVLCVLSWFLKGPRPPARWPTIDKLLSNVLNLERWSCDSMNGIIYMGWRLHSLWEKTTYPYFKPTGSTIYIVHFQGRMVLLPSFTGLEW